MESKSVAGYGKIGAKAMEVGTIGFVFRRLLLALKEGTPFPISSGMLHLIELS